MRNRFPAKAIALSIHLAFCSGTVLANPSGAQVANGQVAFAQPNAVSLQVTNSPGAVINWQSFSIAPGEITRFIQQSAASTVLNRVVGQNLSQIYGTLQSNGRVFLVNPNGILVGPGAVIDTAGFIASSLRMTDADFLAGKLRFAGDASSGAVVNQGRIRTGFGGTVALIAPSVENSGLIETPGGGILLAAGQKVQIASIEHGDVLFEVQAPTDSVVNLGRLLADGGAVGAFAGTLKHSGEIRANALIRDAGGQIVLAGQKDVELAAGSVTAADGRSGGQITVDSASGTARVAGTVHAAGTVGQGGLVEITGERVALVGNAVVDASGTAGGGTVLVGGDWQGANPAVHNAAATFVAAGASITADATSRGDGGKVVVWADGDTRFLGTLSAQGGANGGNGGQAEVSGKGDLLFLGGARLGAPKGRLGNLLLDPLDLFVDSVGGLNPYIIDETTDFPDHAVTVSPATLAAITGNVTLYASRDLRFNSAVALTTAGQGLAASAGRDLQIGAGISTNGGAVALTAARTLQAFAAAPITTSGGNVNLSAQNISASSLTVAAGGGSVTAASSAGSLQIGTIASAGTINLASTGGSLSTSAMTSAGAISLNSNGGSLSTSSLTASGAVTLTSSNSASTGAVATNGGALQMSAASGSASASSVDTRSGGGPGGGAVTLNATGSTVSTGTVQAGNGNITLAGTRVSTGTMTTTGAVSLTATSGNISATVNDAASVVAAASRSFSSVSVNLTSTSTTTPLNATTVTATATNCSSSSSCPSATVTLTGSQGVNVGTVSASAPATTTSGYTPQYQQHNTSVTIDGQAGSIQALSSASQITATDVTLRTTVGSGGGIGSAAVPLKVDVERSFSFAPNGAFDVVLNGSGPNSLNLQVGVAATGTYSGTLTRAGQINLDVAATTTTVTANDFSVTGGFDTPVYGGSPSIQLVVPNGNLVATNVSMPKGDQVGFASCTFYYCGTSILGLGVTLQASNNLTVGTFDRQAGGVYGKAVTFTAGDAGAVTLGTVNGRLDSVSVNAGTDVTIGNSLVTQGNVSIAAAQGSADTGNVTIDGLGINTAGGSGGVTINVLSALAGNGELRAGTDNGALEIAAGGSVNVSARTIGTGGFANPLDVAAPSVTFNTNGYAGTAIGSASGPVVANTANLTINAAGCSTSSGLCVGSFLGGTFNVSTGAVPLTTLTVRADPVLVGSGGLAQVASNGNTYAFNSDGTNFSLAPLVAGGGQFSGGWLDFTTQRGDLTLASVNFSSTNGSLSLTTLGNLANIAQPASNAIDLGAGALTLRADGNVALQAVNAGGMSVANATSYFGSGANYINGYYRTGVASFSNNLQTITDSGAASGSFDVTSRGAITTGDLSVGNVSFTAYSGGISTGLIGSAATPANSIYLYTDYSGGGGITTGAIEANSTQLFAYNGNIATGAINAVNTGASSVQLSAYSGSVAVGGSIDAASVYLQASGSGTAGIVNVTGNINAAAATTHPNNITIQADQSISTGTLDADSVSLGSYYCCSSETVAVGAIGSHLPGNRVEVSGTSVTIGGGVALDGTGSGQTMYLSASGDLTLGGDVTFGQSDGIYLSANGMITLLPGGGNITAANGVSYIDIRAGNGNVALPFQFKTIHAGTDGAGNFGTVRLDAAAGIFQAAGGSGITGGTVTLRSTAANSHMNAFGALAPGALSLHEVRSLTVETGGHVDIHLGGASGAPVLANLDITRNATGTGFSLNDGSSATALNGQQNLTVTDISGGTSVGLANSAATGVNFRYRNGSGSAGNIVAAATTGGGTVTLETSAGSVTTNAIDTRGGAAGDGGVSVSAGTGIVVAGATDSGNGSINLSTSGDIGGAGSLTSGSNVVLSSSGGSIGSVGTPLAVTAPSVQLNASRSGVGGDVHASLTGTTALGVNADNGFTITSSSDLASLDLVTRGDGVGATSLSTATQSFGFARNGSALDISTVASTSPLSNLAITVNAGDIRVIGTGTSSIAADGLSLTASGTLTLDGGSSAIVLSNVSQTFRGTNVLVNGQGALTASAAQEFRSQGGAGDVEFRASGGAIAVNATDQTLASTRDILLQGGTAANEGVTIAATNSQSFSANRHINLFGGSAADTAVAVTLTGSGDQDFASSGGSISLLAGSGDRASVSVTASGAGQQTFLAAGDIILSGGGAAGVTSNSKVLLSKGVGGDQTVYAAGNINLTGGAGDSGSVILENRGGGNQRVGTSSTCCNTYVATDNVTLRGGGGANSSVSVTADGQQTIEAIGTISFLGGSGNDSAIKVTSDHGSQTIGNWNYYYQVDPTDNLVLTGGSGDRAHVLVESNAQQWIRPTSSLALTGGTGTDSYVRIHTNLVTTSGQSINNAAQIVGYGSSGADGYYGSQLGTLSVTGGSGSGSYAEITSASDQRLTSSAMMLTGSATDGVYAQVAARNQYLNTGATTLTAGTGNGAHALISATGTDADTAQYAYPFYPQALQDFRFSSLILTGMGTAGGNTASARVTSGGAQYFSGSTTRLTAGAGPASVAEMTAVTSQSGGLGNVTLAGGSGQDAKARIEAGTSQSLSSSSITMTGGSAARTLAAIKAGTSQSFSSGSVSLAGGTAAGASAAIEAGTSQSLSSGSIALTGGNGAGAGAWIKAASGQTLSGSGSVNLIGGTGAAGSGNDASAMIINQSGTQSIGKGGGTSIFRSGADYAAAGIWNAGASQSVTLGNLTIDTSTGANNGATFGGLYSGIANTGSGSQTVQTNSLTISNTNAPGTVGILTPGAQTVLAFGNLTVQTANATGGAKIATSAGTQTVGASGLMTVQVTGGGGTAAIDATTGTQTIRGTSASTADPGAAASSGSASGGVRVQVAGGSGGTARIANSGGAQTIIAAYVDVNTAAAGTAVVSASGDQAVHTTNGLANSGGSLRVAAIGGGSATLSSGGAQLLQIDYPELMQGARDGRITVGDPTATGVSAIRAVDQDIFARSIAIRGGSAAGAHASIDVSGVQNISLVNSTSTPGGSLTVQGGAGGNAILDPTAQTILSNVPISVVGGSGTGVIGGILAGGDQIIMVTTGGASSIAAQGGSGTDAFGRITTTGPSLQVGTSGDIALTAGSGSNADGVMGAVNGSNFFSCNGVVGGVCSATGLTTDPFANGIADAGVFRTPTIVPLDSIGLQNGSLLSEESPFDLITLLLPPRLWISSPDDEEHIYRRRGLEVCR